MKLLVPDDATSTVAATVVPDQEDQSLHDQNSWATARPHRRREAMREHETIPDALSRAGSELRDILLIHLRDERTAAVEHLKESALAASEPA